MQFKRIYFLLFLILYIFSFCYAEENEEIALQVEGLNIYTLESVNNSNIQSSEWSVNYRTVTMGDFDGFGCEILFKNKKSLKYGVRIDYMTKEENLYDGDFESLIYHYKFIVGKTFPINNFIFFNTTHSLNFIEFGWNYEYESGWYSFDDSDFDEIFTPSIDLSLEAKMSVGNNFSFSYSVNNQIWYTSPKFDMNYIDSKKLSEIYELQHSICFLLKF